MKKIVTACVCALSLFACGTSEKQEEPRNENPGAQAVQAPAKATMTESQVFAYILGQEYGLPPYLNMPPRIGEMLDLDAMVQGVVDNENFLSKPGWKLQVSPDEQKSLEARYEQVAKDREALGENARPVVLAGPITGGKVVLTDTTAPIVKYSYLQGVQIDLEFAGMKKAFDEPFETHYFIMGLRESVMGAIDPSFKKSVPDATLKAVNARFVERMEKIRKEQRGQ